MDAAYKDKMDAGIADNSLKSLVSVRHMKVPAKKRKAYKKSKGRKRTTSLPIRALNAYNFFFREQRKLIVEERDRQAPENKLAGADLFSAMGKEISNRWKKLTPSQLEKYQALAHEDKKRYEREVDNFNRKLSGKDEGINIANSQEETERRENAVEELEGHESASSGTSSPTFQSSAIVLGQQFEPQSSPIPAQILNILKNELRAIPLPSTDSQSPMAMSEQAFRANKNTTQVSTFDHSTAQANTSWVGAPNVALLPPIGAYTTDALLANLLQQQQMHRSVSPPAPQLTPFPGIRGSGVDSRGAEENIFRTLLFVHSLLGQSP